MKAIAVAAVAAVAAAGFAAFPGIGPERALGPVSEGRIVSPRELVEIEFAGCPFKIHISIEKAARAKKARCEFL